MAEILSGGMMSDKPKEITVTMAKKIGQPGYSSISISATATYTNSPWRRAWSDVKNQIRTQEQYIPGAEKVKTGQEDPEWIKEDPDNVVKGRTKAKEAKQEVMDLNKGGGKHASR